MTDSPPLTARWTLCRGLNGKGCSRKARTWGLCRQHATIYRRQMAEAGVEL